MLNREKLMKKNIGLWIDHTKAVIVSFRDRGEDVIQISSHIEKHPKYSSGAKDITSDDILDKKLASVLNQFYDEVILCMRNPDSIYIFGPGDAKTQLVKRLKKAGLGKVISNTETTDKLTDRQIAAKVRYHYVK